MLFSPSLLIQLHCCSINFYPNVLNVHLNVYYNTLNYSNKEWNLNQG